MALASFGVLSVNTVHDEAEESGTARVTPRPQSMANARIDTTRLFIAEEFTPLFYTAQYRDLTTAVRLRYNQLHALYFNEQVAFFEQEMLSPVLLALLRSSLPARLAEGVRSFLEEEREHTAIFRALNLRCAPEFYAAHPYHFIRTARSTRAILRAIAAQPRLFPLFLWLALLQEERSLYYSKRCLARSAELEPQFVATHRAHLADEVGHVERDDELLDWLWPQVGPLLRFINVRLLNWMLGELFYLPKRSGLRVVEQLAREQPELASRALYRGIRELGGSPAYLETLYSRKITPRSFARFDAHPEFALIARTLPAYHPPGLAL